MVWYKEMKIQQNFALVEHRQANRQTEVANRILLQHLKARLKKYKSYWVDEIPRVLWAYHTTSWSLTKETHSSLVYDSETVISMEICEATLLVRIYEKSVNDEARSFDLEVIGEKREATQIQLLKVNNRMVQDFLSGRPHLEVGWSVEPYR